MKIYYFKMIIFLLGITLLGVNISGFFIPLKNPEIYTEEKTGFENDTTLTPKETLNLLHNLNTNNKKNFAISANDIFNQSIAHYWEDDGLKKYRLTIPFHENWLLASFRFAIPSIYKRYEYCDYKKAVERGVGICSQHTIALVDFLNRNSIDSQIIGLDGHVVATANIGNDEWWIFDPDFGISIPHDLSTIEKNPEIIKEFYSRVSYKNNIMTKEKLIEVYGKSGNTIYTISTHPLIGNSGYIDCNWKKVAIEKASSLLKWLIPICLIAPLMYQTIRKRYVK